MTGLIKSLDVQVGVYGTQATITRHRDGQVTIKAPFIKWVNSTGSLAFETIKLSNPAASLASEVFSDSPPMIDNGYGDIYPLGYAEFISEYQHYFRGF